MAQKNSKVLEKLGLSADEVRIAFGIKEKEPEPEKKGYLFRPDQKRMNERMRFWDSMSTLVLWVVCTQK